MILTKIAFEIFKILKRDILTTFFISVTRDPMGVKFLERYSCYKSQTKVFKLVLNVPPNGPHKTTLGILGIFESPIFQFTIIPYRESKKAQISGKRVIVGQTGVKFGTHGYY